MMSRPHVQPYFSNSLAIRQEIQRFESVHPAMYLIYDLIEEIPDQEIAQQLKELIVCIEDSFVSSQEWTLSREVPDLRLGIVGNLFSGKSALVHRYLTGSYMHEESPEGGRFKKEVSIDGQSYLLLIRDEGGIPELQFTSWVDAVIFVFSLENESSFNSIYNYYGRMLRHRNITEIPLVLVGTQDAISETKPRIIDDAAAKKLASDLKISAYYETCATYGLNIDRVFQDACTKVIQQRSNVNIPSSSRPIAPHYIGRTLLNYPPPPVPPVPLVTSGLNSMPPNSGTGSSNGFLCTGPSQGMNVSSSASSLHSGLLIPTSSNSIYVKDPGSYPIIPNHALQDSVKSNNVLYSAEDFKVYNNTVPFSECISAHELNKLSSQLDNCSVGLNKDQKDLPTPSSTPTTSRKTRRRSNLFHPSRKDDDRKGGEELGSGRTIPIKQGYLYKKNSRTLNREWKKKYVTLCEDGRLTYYASINDYMENSHGKDISLQYTTVKIPGQRQRLSKPVSSLTDTSVSLTLGGCKDKKGDKVTLTGYEVFKDKCIDESLAVNGDIKMETPNVKKRHRRMRSSGIRTNECEDSDGYEFSIVSLDNKQWHFEAFSCDERDDWVTAIKQQIFSSLNGNESIKSKFRSSSLVDPASIQTLRTSVEGNNRCADCGAENPDWASLNLGVLICIECSGIHRNLGSHISRVRSLDLDEWPQGHISVMLALGNRCANSVWEASLKGRLKPNPSSNRQEKENWIRNKYEHKEFLRGLPASLLTEQLYEAVARQDVRQVYLLLSHFKPDQLCNVVSHEGKTPLHVSCTLGNLPISQLLIWHKVNVAAQDNTGNVAVVYARHSGCTALVELLSAVSHPKVDQTSSCNTSSGSGTIPRRRGSFSRKTDVFDKLPASVI